MTASTNVNDTPEALNEGTVDQATAAKDCGYDESSKPMPHMSHELTPTEVERYSRQLILPQFGPSSQTNLKDASVLVVGLGGLGSPAALYLAGAGVGTLGLVDRPGDVVETSNLHRQIAHTTSRVGQPKTSSARLAISAANPHVHVVEHDDGLATSSVVTLFRRYDVVLDCTDNVAARYLIGDACAVARRPLVSGAAVGVDGQLTVLCVNDESPCYRCLFPSPPPPACVGSCDAAGVIGPVPGVIGTLQALEAIKLIGQMRRASVLDQRLLLFDGAEASFRTIKMRARSPSCAVCGGDPSVVVEHFDYESFARGGLPPDKPPEFSPSLRIDVNELTKIRARTRLSQTKLSLIDVRPQQEFAMCHLPDSENIPLSTMGQKEVLTQLRNSSHPKLLVCRRGNASRRALKILLDAGVKNVRDVIGGLTAWHDQIDKHFPLY